MIYQCIVTAIRADIVAEGERLVGLASDDGVPLRLLGGVAVRLQAPTVPPALDRAYKDLDLAAPKGGSVAADRLLRAAGYEAHTVFNAPDIYNASPIARSRCWASRSSRSRRSCSP